MPNPYIDYNEFASRSRMFYYVNSLMNELINCEQTFGREAAYEMFDYAIENGIEYYHQKAQRIIQGKD